MKIGFIGLGNMGSAIAVNLLRAGHEVAVWNRSPEKAAALTAAGAKLAATPKDAASGREAVFTMVADDAALEDILTGPDGLLEGLSEAGLHVSMSTIAVATAERITAEHRSRGQRFLCAPVFGRPEAAAAAKLFVVAAGDLAEFRRASPLFEVIGQRAFYLGEKPAAACLVKLCGNFMILAAVEALGEAMALAEKGGIPKARLLEVMTGTLFGAPVYQNYGRILAEERYRPAGFVATLGLKDMRLASQSAEALRVPMPLLGVLRDHLLQTIAIGGEEADWSEIGRTIADNAGLPRIG